MTAEEISTIPFFCKIQLKDYILVQPIYFLLKLTLFFLNRSNTRCWHTASEKRSLNSVVNYFCRTLPLQLSSGTKRKRDIIMKSRQNVDFFFPLLFPPSSNIKEEIYIDSIFRKSNHAFTFA